MGSQKVFSTLVIGCVAVTSWAIFLGAAPAKAQSSAASYTFLVGAGFLCDSGDSATCPAVVRSTEGDTYELSGAGTFERQSKSATAAGTFTHKSADGTVLGTGVWVASELIRFESYGIVPGARMRQGRTLGRPELGPMHLRMFPGSMPAGGRAAFRIRLLPIRGLPKTATLEVNCALGKVPAEHQTEGIRLAFEGNDVKFDEEISGRTMFLLTRPGAGAASTAPAPDDNTNRAPHPTA